MTAREIINKAVIMLGYTDGSGNISTDTQMRRRALTALNLVYSDLYYSLGGTEFSPLTTLEDRVNLPERVLNDVVPYGVAAFLAQSESDGDNQQYYIMLYNSKRAALTRSESIEDTIPTPTE